MKLASCKSALKFYEETVIGSEARTAVVQASFSDSNTDPNRS